MKTAILYQSLRGGTKKLAHSLAEDFHRKGSAVGVYPITEIDAQIGLTDFWLRCAPGSVKQNKYAP